MFNAFLSMLIAPSTKCTININIKFVVHPRTLSEVCATTLKNALIASTICLPLKVNLLEATDPAPSMVEMDAPLLSKKSSDFL